MTTIDQPLPLSVAAYLAAIAHHGEELALHAEEAGMDAPVPTCPDWLVRDLVQHTDAVFRHKTASVLAAGAAAPPERMGPDETVDVDGYRRTLSTMLDVFTTSDLSVPCWTWCSHEHRADWWVRRMAHESAIHAADAVVAAGGVPSIDPLLAVDGVDEILDEMLIGGPDWGIVTPGNDRIDLVAGDRTWNLRFGRFVGTSPNTGKDYDLATLVHDADGVPAAVVTADPGLLDLWMWGRADLGTSNVSGNEALVVSLRELAAEGT